MQKGEPSGDILLSLCRTLTGSAARASVCLLILVSVLLSASAWNGAVVFSDESASGQNRGEQQPTQQGDPGEQQLPDKQKLLFSGKVVLVREALAKRGIKATDELDGQVALETRSGKLYPIVPDWRGRAFFQDERLRNRKVDLIAFKQPELPYLQVLTVFAFDKQGQRQYVDYWCEICAIPMYEIQQCQCCQGDVELRFQPRELPKQYRTTGDSSN